MNKDFSYRQISIRLLAGGLCLWMAACANSPDLLQYNQRPIYVLKTPPPAPIQTVRGVSISLSKFKETQKACSSQGLLLIGSMIFIGPMVSTTDVQKACAQAGGDYYVFVGDPYGVATGSRMVPVSYTTPKVISSSSQGSAYGNYTGNYQNNCGYNANMYANANAQGFGSSQTVVGGTTTYQRETFNYQTFSQCIHVLASPARQIELYKLGVLSKTN